MFFNQDRARKLMRRYEIDALVATSAVNITYFSDYFCWMDTKFKEYMGNPGAPANLLPAYAVFPLEGEPALVVASMLAVNAADSWVRDLYLCGEPVFDRSLIPTELSTAYGSFYQLLQKDPPSSTATGALLSALKQRGLSAARIGIEMDGLLPNLGEEIMRALPNADMRDCSDLIRLIRMVKSSDEIINLKRSAEINEQAAMESLALARPGRPISDLAGHFHERIGELGAEFDHYAFDVCGMGIATEPNYILRANDVMFVDFGCIYHHYFSDTGTTLALGSVSLEFSQRHAALRECVESATEVMKPGVNVSAVRAAMWQTLNERGVTASSPHGHGLGLEVRDYPIVVANNGLRIKDDCVDVPSDLPLEADMVVNLESAVFVPGIGSVHIEKSFLISENGNVPLVPQDRSAPVVVF